MEGELKVFLTGATGYIGGSVAQRLLEAGHQVLGLTRDAQKAEALRRLGVAPVIGDLAQQSLLADTARQADAVINAADADNRAVAETLLDALAGSGKRYIQTSGSSIVATDAGGSLLDAIYDEDTPFTPDPARATRVAIDRLVTASTARGVHPIVICPTLIYGRGLGLNKRSIQLPKLIASSKAAGVGLHIGKGENRWSNVHIADLADLYRLALERAPAGSFFYAENGENSFKEVAAAISTLLGFQGRTAEWPLADAAAQWGDTRVRYSLGSNSRVRARKARELLGWRPHRPSLLESIKAGENEY
jgi:nucleoside-diphosphate-sugar epimerase